MKYRSLREDLVNEVKPYAFWSFKDVDSSKISDDVLIEAVLRHGNDSSRNCLFQLFERDQIMAVWENNLVIQGSRLQNLNLRLASDLFQIGDSKGYIRQLYAKNNLYDRFSA